MSGLSQVAWALLQACLELSGTDSGLPGTQLSWSDLSCAILRTFGDGLRLSGVLSGYLCWAIGGYRGLSGTVSGCLGLSCALSGCLRMFWGSRCLKLGLSQVVWVIFGLCGGCIRLSLAVWGCLGLSQLSSAYSACLWLSQDCIGLSLSCGC